ncbi:MAG: cysteine desulfurase [Lachnospiraceae bacterium]|nr:cysteine desulfurase [Lachnospiraceae bacterium]
MNSLNKEIYLDNSATTRVHPEVVTLVSQIMSEDYGNPSSMHNKGVEAERYVINATKQIAKVLKASEKEILFTSGGTESDNLALIGGAKANQRAGKHIITTAIEHPAILNTCKYLEEEGFEISYLHVDEYGVIDLDELKSLIRPDTILVSVMYVNNEVGSVQPIQEAGALIKSINKNTLFHVDAVQGFGKCEIYPGKMNVDLMSVSGHKIHGPKGIGFLYVKTGTKLKPISFGGGQQGGMRNGTLNVPGIAGIGLASELITKDLEAEREKLFSLKSFFLQEIEKIDRVSVNGVKKDETGAFLVKETAPHIMNISVKGLRSEVMLHALEEEGIYISAGSACASHSKKTSSTLKSMGKSAEEMDGALRISMSLFTEKEDLITLVDAIKRAIEVYGRFVRK